MTNLLAATLAASLLLGATQAGAQALDRSKRPVAPPAPAFKFPKTQTQKLANGLRIVVVEDHGLPLVTVRAVVDADSTCDPVGKEGLYTITSGMLRDGTKTMSADQLAAAFATLGNSVVAGIVKSTPITTPLKFTTIPSNVDRSLALMADMLEHPSFRDEDLTRRKAALILVNQRRLESAATAPNQLLLKQLLGEENASARSFLASAASITSITRDDVVKFYAAYFQPSATTIIVVGDVQAPSAIAEIKKQFSGWTGAAATARPAPVAVVRHPTTIYLIDQPGAKQTQIAVGTVGPARDSRDAAALDVMSYVLGNGSTSRISQNLREKHSYMYSGTALAMNWHPVPDVSVISGLIPVNPAKSDSALIEWLGELRGMRDHPPTPQEMSVAQGILVSTLASQVETVDLTADRVTYLIRNDLPLTYYDGYASQVMHVTPRDVSAVAAKYLDPSQLVIVVAGDRKLLQPMLEAAKLGAVVVVDK